MVYCSFWQQKFDKSNASTPEEFIKKEIFDKFDHPRKVALGWGYPNRFVDDVSWVIKGTASEGLMLNGQILISKDDYCQYFAIRE